MTAARGRCHCCSPLLFFKERLQAMAGNAGDFSKRRRELACAIALEPLGTSRDDLAPLEPFHGDDERKAKLCVVGAVERVQAGKISGGGAGPARAPPPPDRPLCKVPP